MSNPSYYPIKIIYTDNNEILVLKAPEEIQSGRPFRVLEIRVK